MAAVGAGVVLPAGRVRWVPLARFDGLLDRVQKARGPYVITHGEPHPGNLLRTLTGLRLIDWDMIALARPERDLWNSCPRSSFLSRSSAAAA